MPESNVTNILVVGIGGQGVMTATEILAEAAIALGHDVKKTEVAGMAQRGGVVSSHLRFGPKVLSPQIMPGTADLLVAFEAAEGLRWCHYLKPGGLVLLNTAHIVPPVVDIGLYEYPADPIAEIRAKGYRVHAFDAMKIALELGDVRLGNTVMLGAMADHLPFPAEVLLEAIVKRFRARKPQMVELNQRAFEAGRAAEKAAAHQKAEAIA
ncbi:indolepyruvate oxidoreductase subunit beta [Sulfuricystis thermophila]|uniref:indolepyruvate oxidoreductase subunit beta n=1 Tax=Sulfuricystis thermophila TaxID=2496847 RepID=UPI001035A7CE|nr:indolepyruvate oxidoreductase subunit beta [Sulfuricystis thermophila]